MLPRELANEPSATVGLPLWASSSNLQDDDDDDAEENCVDVDDTCAINFADGEEDDIGIALVVMSMIVTLVVMAMTHFHGNHGDGNDGSLISQLVDLGCRLVGQKPFLVK